MKAKFKFEEINCTGFGEFDERIKEVSEMIHSERLFLNGLISHFKPRKLLEVGVAAGGSSALILNAIKDIPDAKLYSHDYNRNYYRGDGRLSGFVVNETCPELMDKWQLFTGGMVAEHLEEIGGDIDFVLLDTMHSNPGEFLDFLMVLPYLRENAVVVVHDISLHMGPHDWCRRATTCGVLFAALKGTKHMPESLLNYHTHAYMTDNLPLANIGAAVLESDIMSHAWDYFHLLSLPWEYRVSERDFEVAKSHFEHHYGETHSMAFVTCGNHNHGILDRSSNATDNKTVEVRKAGGLEYKKRISFMGIPLLKIIARNNNTVIKFLGILPLMRIVRK